jgi:hypothetical protein
MEGDTAKIRLWAATKLRELLARLTKQALEALRGR